MTATKLVDDGLAKRQSGDVVGAYQSFGVALLQNPDYPEALVNMAALIANRELIKAQVCLMQRAAAVAPAKYEVQFNLGCALMRVGRYQEARIALERAAEKASQAQRPQAFHHLGMVLHDLGRFEGAIAAYDKALGIRWERELAQDRALSLIANGDLIEGFKAFEARWELIPKHPIWKENIPLWQGGDMEGKTIIVSHEQGWGDTIQICRFLPMLKRRYGAGRVIFSGPSNIGSLVGANFDVDIVGTEGPFGGPDLHCPAMSLPYRLGIDWPHIEGRPYLSAVPRKLPRRGKINVGVCWAGSAKYVADSARSMSFSDLIPLFDIPEIGFFSLQKGSAEQDLKESGLIGLVADLSPMLTDWQASASVIAGLDAVVTVDTSVAHLSAALGVPTFTMIPASHCWRWPRHGERTPWYDSMRLMRQSEPFEWRDVVYGIRNRLVEMKSAKLAKAA